MGYKATTNLLSALKLQDELNKPWFQGPETARKILEKIKQRAKDHKKYPTTFTASTISKIVATKIAQEIEIEEIIVRFVKRIEPFVHSFCFICFGVGSLVCLYQATRFTESLQLC